MKLHGRKPVVSHISSRNPPKHPPSLFGLRRVRRALIPGLTPEVFSRRRIKRGAGIIIHTSAELSTALIRVVWVAALPRGLRSRTGCDDSCLLLRNRSCYKHSKHFWNQIHDLTPFQSLVVMIIPS